MPQVPELVPSVAPSLGGVGGPQVSATPEAFGANIGAAVQHLGGAVEASADKIWERAMQMQDLNNRAAVDRADAEFMKQAGEEHAKFSAMEGTAAQEYYQSGKYADRLNAIRENVRSTMTTNPMQQRMFDSTSLSTYGRTLFNGAGHAGQQAHVAAVDAATANVGTASRMATSAKNPDDAAYWEQRALRKVDELHQIQGRPGSTQEKQTEVSAEITSGRIETLYNDGDIAGARQLLESRRSILGDRYGKLEGAINHQEITIGSINMAQDEYNSGVKDGEQTKSLGEMEDNIRTQVKERYKDNPSFETKMEKQAVRELQTVHRQNVQAEKQLQYTSQQVLQEALGTDTVKSLQDLKANPASAAAFKNLSPTQQNEWDGKIKSYWHNKDALVKEGHARYLWGLANAPDNPEARQKFLDADLDKEPLGEGDYMKLVSKRAQILNKKGSQNLGLSRAMTMLKPELEASSFTEKIEGDSYWKFVGGMEDELNEWNKNNPNKSPDLDQLRAMKMQLMSQIKYKHWWGTEGTQRFFEQSVPSGDYERIRDDKSKSGYEPDPNEIQRAYVSEKFQERFGGSATRTNKTQEKRP